MCKSNSFQENKMLKIIWDIEIHADQQIPARRPDQVLINKKKRTDHLVDFEVHVGWSVRFYGISTFVGYLMPNPFLCK